MGVDVCITFGRIGQISQDYVSIYVCMYVCMYYFWTHKSEYIRICKYVYTNMYVCMYVCMYGHTYVCMYVLCT